jgi:signal transduction histidine kinase
MKLLARAPAPTQRDPVVSSRDAPTTSVESPTVAERDTPQPTRERRRLRLGSARVRILAWVLLLLVVAGGLALFAQREVLIDDLEGEVDRSLVQEVEEVRVLAAGRDPNTGLPFDGNVAAIFDTFLRRNIPHEDEVLLAYIDGELYRETHGALTIGTDRALRSEITGITALEEGRLDTSAGPVSFMAVPLAVGADTQGVFVVAHFLQAELDEIDRITQIGALVYGSVILLAFALAWILAGRVLQPVREVTATAKELTGTDLSRRITVRDTDDEIAELARTFNLMLDRLDGAFRQQREFLDDAGHELRTPITIIRGHLELEGLDAAERDLTRAVIRDELDRMSRIVDDLLVLARSEQPDFLERAALDVDLLTTEVFAKAKALADRDWKLTRTGHGVIVGDRQRLTQALVNLLDNAARHSPASAPIEFGSTIVGGDARFWVKDHGPGIPDADRERIFRRFTRVNSGRSSGGTAGLGLAIVRAIAEAHGGRVELDTTVGHGTTFTLVVPVA